MFACGLQLPVSNIRAAASSASCFLNITALRVRFNQMISLNEVSDCDTFHFFRAHRHIRYTAVVLHNFFFAFLRRLLRGFPLEREHVALREY